MKHVLIGEINNDADAIMAAVDQLELAICNFQADLDSNPDARGMLEWYYYDLRKTMNTLISQAKELKSNTEDAVDELE